MKINDIYKASRLVICSMLLVLNGCAELDVEPKDRLSEEALWSDQKNADLFLNDIYNNLPHDNRSNDTFDNWTDNSMCGYAWTVSRNIIRDASWTADNVDDIFEQSGNRTWEEYYANIRKCNLFIEKVSAADFPEEYKTPRLAEARFLRAFFYQELMKFYGGVPLITQVLDQASQGEDIFYARNTLEETINFILKECKEAAAALPESYSGADAGRITKGAALTLKGWTELFTGKWEAAAATNRQIIGELGHKGNGTYDLFPDYEALFHGDNNNSVESILASQFAPRTRGGTREGKMGPTYVNNAYSSWGGVNPTQELVDVYRMANGKSINDPTSGYDPQNPYEGREKRFYQTIIYDGAPWRGDIIYTRQGMGSLNEIDLADGDDVTNTGYYIRKALDERIPAGADNWNGQTGGNNWMIFRYAEVLLNYAEAQNEAAGPDPSVYEAINYLRARSELPALESGLSQEEMRTAIHRERRIELAFEGKRWWDLIRWKKAEEVLNGSLHGMVISGGNGALEYTPVSVMERKFDPSINYLMPIPQIVLDRNDKIEQNNGY